MNLIEDIARMIDMEGAYCVGFPSTDIAAEPIPFTTRQKYFQATYELLAMRIAKKLLYLSPDKVRAELIAFEKAGWERLGLDLSKCADAEGIIAAKYAPAVEDAEVRP